MRTNEAWYGVVYRFPFILSIFIKNLTWYNFSDIQGCLWGSKWETRFLNHFQEAIFQKAYYKSSFFWWVRFYVSFKVISIKKSEIELICTCESRRESIKNRNWLKKLLARALLIRHKFFRVLSVARSTFSRRFFQEVMKRQVRYSSLPPTKLDDQVETILRYGFEALPVLIYQN